MSDLNYLPLDDDDLLLIRDALVRLVCLEQQTGSEVERADALAALSAFRNAVHQLQY